MVSLAPRLTQTPAPSISYGGLIEELGREIAAGTIIPYLGPGVEACGPKTSVPLTTEGLALALSARVPVGAKLKGNMWGTAQYIEQRRHRKTLVAFMSEIFKAPVEPGPLHAWLARQKVPLVVDTWYDGALARAFKQAGRTDFVEVQGVTRALENRDVWVKTYDADGREIANEAALVAPTVLYEPHGSAKPASNFLVADSDYVEVLSEIDIQTPIPAVIQERRTPRGFVFMGCRFDDQMLRTYARQIMKRSTGPRYVIVDYEPTRMELKFFEEQGIEVIACCLEDAIGIITAN